MKAYRYKTKISSTGKILIPVSPALYDKEVDVIILPKKREKRKELKAVDFVNKWAGFLKNDDIEKSKYDYLSEKYK